MNSKYGTPITKGYFAVVSDPDGQWKTGTKFKASEIVGDAFVGGTLFSRAHKKDVVLKVEDYSRYMFNGKFLYRI
jgi:hypothetical protein